MSVYGGESSLVDIDACAKEKNAIIVDLRTDTVTKPSTAMREAMANAVVGDDVFGEDPTVNELERMAADMVGKEAALFVTSGTMGNLIAIMVHCEARGCEAYCAQDSHVTLHEQGGAAQLAGVTICPIANDDDNGTFSLRVLKSRLKSDRLHEPTSRLVIAENTWDGRVLSRDWLDELSAIARERNLKLHMDGARLWNASIASGIPAVKIVENFDSVTFCLSKALGAPAGSLLCGSREFVGRARRVRKVLGGGMRQAGVLAAAGIVALTETMPMLHRDHEKARLLEAAIARVVREVPTLAGVIRVSEDRTNMVFIDAKEGRDSPFEGRTFVKRLGELGDDPGEPRVLVRALALTDRKIRFVLHRDVNDDALNAAVRKIEHVMRKY